MAASRKPSKSTKAATTATARRSGKPGKAAKPAKSATASPGKAAVRRPAPRNAVRAARKEARPAESSKLVYRNVTPLLVVDGASDAIAWYARVFGAKELSRQALPTGKLMHAAIRIGDSILMLADAFDGPAPKQMVGVTLHIQSPDIERFWNNAVAGGASVVMPMANMFWGDRYGQLRDPFGHHWSLGWPVKLTPAEKERLQREAFEHVAATAPPS